MWVCSVNKGRGGGAVCATSAPLFGLNHVRSKSSVTLGNIKNIFETMMMLRS